MYPQARAWRLRQLRPGSSWHRLRRSRIQNVTVRRMVSTWRPASNDRICSTLPSEHFKRYWEAPSMEPATVLTMLKRLHAERSGDVPLLQALSHRYLAQAEEYFPPQIDELVALFADLGYADEELLQGFTGRLTDVIPDASPRRVVRLLRNTARLQLPTDMWVDAVFEQLHRHLPNLREGLPSVLASLRLLGRRDEELAELLLTQGLLYSDELGPTFFSKLFERWSWHGLRHTEAETRAADMALNNGAILDMRDCLNLLAGLWRSGDQKAALTLEKKVASRLQSASSSDAVEALSWMHRLRLRSPLLWSESFNIVELALKDHLFVREHLPDAIHALTSLIGEAGAGNAELEREVDMISRLFDTLDTCVIARYDASQTLKLFYASSLLAALCKGNSGLEAKLAQSLPWEMITRQAGRLSRQLSLIERRLFVAAAEVAMDFGRRRGLSIELQKLLVSLPVIALPPLPAFVHADKASKAAVATASIGLGSFEGLWLPSKKRKADNHGDNLKGIRYLGPGDTFVELSGSNNFTPSCVLVKQALELRGWKVSLQEKEDLHLVKKMLKMAETQHLAAMKDLRETVDKLEENKRLETGAKFALDAAEARNNSLHVELLVARRGADQESATQADLETRLQASEAFGSELERQLQVANEEYLAAEQLCKQVGSDFSTPSRSSQTWKETSDCSTSASSPHLRRPESSPCTTLPESGEDEKSELEYRWLSAALSEVQDVRGELTQSMLRIAQLEKSKDDLEDKLVATSAEQYVLNIECTESREHEELKDELERRVQDSKDRLDEMEGERSELRRKLAALTADHARLSLAYRTPAKLMWLVEAAIVFFTLEDFDYDAFMSDEVLVNRFRSKVKEVIASEAGEGVQPHYVELEICAGSLKVIAKVETSSGQEVSAQIALCTSTELETRLVESVKSIPGISKVWNSSTLTDFKLEVPWPAEVESRLRESAKKHLDMQRKLNHSAQLRDSLVTKWLLHSARTKLQAEAQEEKLRSLELEQDVLRGEFKDAALRSVVETVTTRLEMDAALDIGRSETEMQQKLEESHECLQRCHEETLSALSVAESRREELEADAVAWLAATREACTEQDALRKCLTSTLDSEAELKSELDTRKSENSELRMHLQHEMEAHAAKNRFDDLAPEDKFQIEFEEEGASLLFFINEFHEFEVWAVTDVLHAERWDVHPGDIITGANGEKFPRNDRDALRQALQQLLSSSKPVLFDLRHKKKAGRLSIFSQDMHLHEAPVELHKATISYEHRTTCLKDLNKWWKEWMEVLGVADKEEFKSKYPSYEQLTYDKNGVDVQLPDINNVSEERFPVTFEVRLQSKSKAPSELHRKTISYQDRATWRDDLQKWWMSLMESVGVADKMDFKGKLSSSEIVIRLYDKNGCDLQLADMDDLSEDRFPVTFEIRLLSKAQADATRLERVLAEHSATKAEFDEERAACVAASELAKSEEVAWRNAIKTHAEKDRAWSNARLETSHAEKDAEIMKNALQAHATLQASAVEKDKAALLENRTPEPEGWYDSQAEKKVEAAEALYAALKKDHDTTVKNLKKREEEYSHLEVDHASKKNMLKELEEATEKAKVDAEKAKRQNESLKEELEQEKRKGKCCSQM